MALLGEEEEDDDDVGTESLSSSEEEEEDEETDSEDEHDSDEDEESDDEDDDSSDSSSLGSTIERMEAEAAANGRPPPRSSMVMLGLGNRAMSSRSIGSSSGTITAEPRPRGMRRNQKSAPNLLELDIPVAAAMVSTPQQKDSLRSFMARMNSAQLIMQHDADAHTVAETPVVKPTTPQQDEPDTTALINDGSNSTRSKVRKSRSANALGDMLKTERSSRDKNSPTRMLEQLWEQVILVESSTTTELTVATDHDDTNAPVAKKPHARMKDWIPPAFWDTYFDLITEQRIDAYTRPIVTAMRALDLTTIKQIVAEHGPQVMNACNRQGESLMHLAFRRGNVDIINYMLHDVKASLTVRDDWNKTPLHDLCWYTKTNLENHGARAWQCIVLHVMQHAPALFFARDRRGFLPLQYVPQECFGDWCKFLDDNNALLKWRIDYLDFQRIRFRLQKTLTRAKDQIKRQEERQQHRRQQAVEEQMTPTTTTTKEG
eukprot:Sro113_g055950.1 ANK (488) ;mRNA; f:21469-22932